MKINNPPSLGRYFVEFRRKQEKHSYRNVFKGIFDFVLSLLTDFKWFISQTVIY